MGLRKPHRRSERAGVNILEFRGLRHLSDGYISEHCIESKQDEDVKTRSIQPDKTKEVDGVANDSSLISHVSSIISPSDPTTDWYRKRTKHTRPVCEIRIIRN